MNNDAYIRVISGRSRTEGVFYEPRAYFGVYNWGAETHDDLLPPTEQYADLGAYRNNERFPVRITHMTQSVVAAGSDTVNMSLLWNMGLRISSGDRDYQNVQTLTNQLGANPSNLMGAAWSNTVSALGPELAQGTSVWQFARPFILSTRDSLLVTTRLAIPLPVIAPPIEPELNVVISACFEGVGLMTDRPYRFESFVVVNPQDVGSYTLDPDLLRNDGLEPVAINKMTVTMRNPSNFSTGMGDTRNFGFQVQQIGNGTNAQWFQGQTVAPNVPNFLAANIGVHAGQALVYEFPTDDEGVQGFLLQPGEGPTITQNLLSPDVFETTGSFSTVIALHGYLIVT